MTCEERLLREGRKQEASLFNLVKPDVSLHDTCNYRWLLARGPIAGHCTIAQPLQHVHGLRIAVWRSSTDRLKLKQ